MQITAGNGGGETLPKLIGLCPVKVLAINPTRDELEKMYGKVLEKDPVYVYNKDNRRSALVNIYLQTAGPVGGSPRRMNLKIWISSDIVLFASDEEVNGTKIKVEQCQVTDHYGNFAYVTKDEFKASKAPKKGRIVGQYKPAHRGEETLISFIKTWLNVAEATEWDSISRTWMPKDAATLDKAKIAYNWEDWLNGDFSDLNMLVKEYKDKVVNVILGIEKDHKNVYRQYVFDKVFLPDWRNTISDFDKKKVDNFLKGETSVWNKETNEKTKVKRSDIYQLSTEPVHEWQLETTQVEQKGEAMPSLQVAVSNAGSKEKQPEPKLKATADPFEQFVTQQSSVAGNADSLPNLDPANFEPDDDPNDLPF